jgi:hypothetical protein
MEEEYQSVHEIKPNTVSDNNETNHITVYQVQGIADTNTGLIIKAGILENPHDILIREFEILSKFKCFMVSRLYHQNELNENKEIVVDLNCHTNIPGVFACGDVTSIKGKQIIIAAGEGAKAALEAYDYVMKT